MRKINKQINLYSSLLTAQFNIILEWVAAR